MIWREHALIHCAIEHFGFFHAIKSKIGDYSFKAESTKDDTATPFRYP
jgi:hypothetical protein